MGPGARRPPRESEFCEMWKVTLRDLAMFEAEDGFMEAVAGYMGHWLGERHAVFEAVLRRATNVKDPEHMKFVDKYLALTQPRTTVAKHPATEPIPPAGLDASGDDSAAVDLTRE